MNRDNKGFTLLEVIIGIAIFTVVVGIGYNTFNKITISSKENQDIYDSQLSINTLNKYITRDLELLEPNSLIESDLSNTEKEDYAYIFKVNGFKDGDTIIEYIKYEVGQGTKDFTINRKTYKNEDDLINNISASNIELLKGKLKSVNELPFKITKNGDSGALYDVSVSSSHKNSAMYSFIVGSRYITSKDEISDGNNDIEVEEPINPPDMGDGSVEKPLPVPEVPEIDDELQGSNGLNGYVRFGNRGGQNYTVIGSSKLVEAKLPAYGGQHSGDNNKNAFNFNLTLHFNNNSGHVDNSLDGESVKIDNSKTKDDFGKLSINQVNLIVKEGARAKVTIIQKHANNTNDEVILYKDLELNKAGKYIFPVDENGKDIMISGVLYIDTIEGKAKKGEIVFTFGTKVN